MSNNIFKLAAGATPFAFAMAFATPAAAVVVLTPSPYTAPSSAVTSTGAQSGTSVTGATSGGVGFTFSSPSTLTTGAAGTVGFKGPFQTVTLTPDANYGFSQIDFSVDVLKFSKKNFYADFVLNLVGGGSVLFDNVLLKKGGNSQFLVSGNAGELFSSISITGWLNKENTIPGSFTKIEHVNVDTVSLSAVPEPTTWAMMIAGIGLVGASMRRRRTAGQAALA